MFKWFRKKEDPARREAAEAAAKIQPEATPAPEDLSGVPPEEAAGEGLPVEAPENDAGESLPGDAPEAVDGEGSPDDGSGAVAGEGLTGEAPAIAAAEVLEVETATSVEAEELPVDARETAGREAPAEADPPRRGLFAKFKAGLSATRERLAGRIETLLSSVRSIDDDVLDELEELLITADLGIKTTSELLFKIRGQVAAKELRDAEALKQALKKRLREMLDLSQPPPPEVKPLVVMVVGINGVGKTTTIAKLCKRWQGEGRRVLLAAGDTFRSAAVEQLGVWAERLGADLVSQPTGSKSSAVVFDAVSAAQTRGSDVVLIDTAGRLHTKVNLMDELIKIKRVAGKAMAGAPHHTILVLDGNTGQNALLQAQTFHQAVGVDSIIMTKLDGTAKGGVIVAIANEMKIPITHIGLGESFDDLQPFDPEAFTEAILAAD